MLIKAWAMFLRDRHGTKHVAFVHVKVQSTNVCNVYQCASTWPTHTLHKCVCFSILTNTLRLHLIFCIALGASWHLPCNPHPSHELLISSYHGGSTIERVASLECHCCSAVIRSMSMKHRYREACWNWAYLLFSRICQSVVPHNSTFHSLYY